MENREIAKKLLDETVAFYNSSNRGVNETKEGLLYGRCQYRTKEGKCCAIGRIMLKEALEEVSKMRNYPVGWLLTLVDRGASEMFMEPYDKLLNEQYIGFLGRIQKLHDNDIFWNENGLTEYGKVEVAIIRKEFELE